MISTRIVKADRRRLRFSRRFVLQVRRAVDPPSLATAGRRERGLSISIGRAGPVVDRPGEAPITKHQ
jgi:hypothetical protein